MDHSLAMAKGLVSLNEAMSHAMPGHPRQIGHSGEFWQNMVCWRRKWQPTPVLLPWEPHEQYEKAKHMTLKDEPPRLEDVQYAAGEEQMPVTNNSRKNEAAGPKWMCLVGKVKSNAIKNNNA